MCDGLAGGVAMIQTEWISEPAEPTRIRPEVVSDIVWVLTHGASSDVDVVSRLLRLLGASEAEVDAAFAIARDQLGVPPEQIDALLARIAQLVFGAVPDDARELDEPPGD